MTPTMPVVIQCGEATHAANLTAEQIADALLEIAGMVLPETSASLPEQRGVAIGATSIGEG